MVPVYPDKLSAHVAASNLANRRVLEREGYCVSKDNN